LPHVFGYDTAVGSGLIGSGNWTLLWKGPLFMSGKSSGVAVLAFFSTWRVHGRDRDDSHRSDGRAVEVEQLRRVGSVCGANLLPAVRRMDVGRRLAREVGASANLGHGYGRLRGFGCGATRWAAPRRSLGAIVLGPRIGKYRSNGKPNAIPGHSIPMALTGVIILFVRLVRLQRRVDVGRDRHGASR